MRWRVRRASKPVEQACSKGSLSWYRKQLASAPTDQEFLAALRLSFHQHTLPDPFQEMLMSRWLDTVKLPPAHNPLPDNLTSGER